MTIYCFAGKPSARPPAHQPEQDNCITFSPIGAKPFVARLCRRPMHLRPAPPIPNTASNTPTLAAPDPLCGRQIPIARAA
jgi:hypothetical protein